MPIVYLDRFYQDTNVTLSQIKIKDITHIPIFCLENPWKENIPNESCIPLGLYTCEHFNGAKYKDVWEVTNVPSRTYILFHEGNYAKDTKGCILPGLGISFTGDQYMVTRSKMGMDWMRQTLGESQFHLIVRKAEHHNVTASNRTDI